MERSRSTALSTSLKQAVDETRDRHVNAVNACDAEAASRLFAAESVFLPPGQQALEGIPAIHAWFTHVFGQFSIAGFGLEPGGVEQRGDVVIEHGNWKARFQPRDGSMRMPGSGTYLTIYERAADGSVSILRDTFNGLPG